MNVWGEEDSKVNNVEEKKSDWEEEARNLIHFVGHPFVPVWRSCSLQGEVASIQENLGDEGNLKLH